MIDKERINIDWIEKVSKVNRNADKILVEKVIRAFLLLEGLVLSGIPFVFKGGTSMMLLTNSNRRLSIDIDIIIPKFINNIDEILRDLAYKQNFLRVDTQERVSTANVPKSHYKFYYMPIHKTAQNEEYVLLDVLFEQIPYCFVSKYEIASKFTPVVAPPIFVDVPCAEDLLGDKLTAFAPNTTGIPYFKNGTSMSMEIIKQLYDVGCLFDLSKDINIVKNTFEQIARKEIKYRDSVICISDILEDIFRTSLCISSRGTIIKEAFEELQNGIKRVKGFIFAEPYYIENAVVSASKAAYLSTLIATNATKIEKYSNPLQAKDWTITDLSYNILNKLKKTNTEAFFYWYKAINQIKNEQEKQ